MSAPSEGRPATSIPVLVALGAPADLESVLAALRARAMRPIVALDAESALRLLGLWRPRVMVAAAGLPRFPSLFHHLEALQLPLVLVGGCDQLRVAERIRTVKAAVVMPANVDDIAATAFIASGNGPLGSADEGLLVAGDVRVDTVRHLAFVGDDEVRLPPKEFTILTELARRPGEAISSAELVSRIWPENTGMTTDDVRRHVYRLRRLLHDDARRAPIVRHRRGYGYLLDRSPAI